MFDEFTQLDLYVTHVFVSKMGHKFVNRHLVLLDPDIVEQMKGYYLYNINICTSSCYNIAYLPYNGF